jgi:hypothetical protein
MPDFKSFRDLDDVGLFTQIITDHFTHAWDEVTGAVSVTPVVSEERVGFAFELYQANLKALRLKVPSQDPDHYKRSACLLDALIHAQVIEDVTYDQGRIDELESGMMHGVNYDEAQEEVARIKVEGQAMLLKLFEFFGHNANEGMAFDLAFRCCQTYETADRPYGPHYFESVIHYLCEYDGGDIGGLYLIFKGYWDAS